MFEKIIYFSIHNKLIISFLLLGTVIWGGVSLTQLPIDAIPDVTNNQVVILTQSPTLATQEVEQYITSPIELQVANLQGVTEIRSTSRQGLSVITLVFEEDTPIYLARQMVAEQLKIAEGIIPTAFGTPELAPITTGLGEIYQYTLVPKKGFESKYSLTDLRTIQDWVVKRQLAGISGVIEISSFGGFVKQYEVSVNPEKLRANNISISELYDAVSKNNANTGGSFIEKNDQAYFIRGEGAAQNLEDLAQIVVKNAGGVPVLVRDIAEVKFGHANRFGAMTRDGESEAVGAVVLMLKGADSEKTIKGVKERIARVQKNLPEGLAISAFIDRTKLIDKSIRTVQTNLLEGGIIVVFVLVLLLGSIRAGLLVASVIPLTMLITFGLMNQFGISGNLMSLGAIDFGLLVDCSVIVVEAVLFQLHHEKRFKIPLIPQETMNTMVGTSASKVLSSAIFGGFIILIVYLPLMTLAGVEGKMFKPMAFTVSIAILVALLLSLTYIPMMASWVLRKEGNKHFAFSDKIVNKLYNLYEPLVLKALKFQKTTIAAAVIMLIASIFVFSRMGGEFIPTLDEGDLAVDFQTPAGSSLTATIDATLQAQKALKEAFPEIIQVVGRIGSSEIPTDPMPVEAADLMINMKDRLEWTSAGNREEMVAKMAAVLEEKVPGASAEFTQPIQMRFNEMISGAKSEIVVKIFGEDLDQLAKKAAECERIIQKIEGVASVKVERVTGLPQIRVKFDKQKMAQYGLNVEELNLILKTAFAGETAGVIFEKERRFDVAVRFDSVYRSDIEQVKVLPIRTASGSFINFSEVADIEYVTGPAQISREATKRRITIGVGILNRDVESIVADIQQNVETKVDLPTGYYFEYGGAFENLQAAKERLSIALPIALLLIFAMLYFTFSSFKQSLMIFTAIPLSAIGGVFALWLRGMPFSISAGVGFIALFGVAVLNGIVLIGYLNQLENEGVTDVLARVKQGVKVRFRPVIMTAAVASLGFLPMALSTSAGAEVQKPLATVVIGGLISATLLTLVVLPVLYVIFSRNKKIKMVNTKGIALVIFFLGLTQFANSQQFTLNEIEQIALDNNRTLVTNKLEIERNQASVMTYRDIPKTDFDLQYGNIQTPFVRDYTLSIVQRFDNPKVYQARKKLLETYVKQANTQFDLQKLDVKRQIREQYYTFVYQLQLKKILQSQLESYQRASQKAAIRYEAGETSILEKIHFEAQLDALTNRIEVVEQQAKLPYLNLQNLSATSDTLLLDERDFFDKQVIGFTVADSPLLQQFESLKETTQESINLEKTQLKPGFIGGITNQSMNGSLRQFFVTGGVSIPLFKEASKAKVEVLRIENQVIDSKMANVENQLLTELNRLNVEHAIAQRNLDYLENTAIPQADLLINTATNQYGQGDINYLEFQQIYLRAIGQKEKFLNQQFSQKLTETAIQYIMGK
jgi:cobalt-zinc-cadmium resistance protein CzcA